MSELRAAEGEIEAGRRLRRGEWYRVAVVAPAGGVVVRLRCRTLRDARATQARYERRGDCVVLSIHG